MRAEDLIALTAARGADASRAFEVPGTGPVRWTVAEAGMACAGLTRAEYYAVLFAYAGDDGCAHHLRRELAAYLTHLDRVVSWPALVSREPINPPDLIGPPAPPRLAPWQPDLVLLSLIQFRQPWRYALPKRDPALLAAAMGVTRHSWRTQLSGPFAMLQWRIVDWLGSATGAMRRWLRGSRKVGEREFPRKPLTTLIGVVSSHPS